jgi:uncharacterized phage infection (PIP) family protein YhgE
MKNLLILLLSVLLVVGMTLPGHAQPVSQDDDDLDAIAIDGGKGKGKRQVSADQMIERIRERKGKILERLKLHYDKMPERLEKMEARIDQLAERMQKAPKAEGKDAAPRQDRLAKIKERITARYEKFKTMVPQRQAKFQENLAKRREKLTQRLKNLKADDQAKVLAEFEAAQKEVGAEIEKLATEAKSKLEATFAKIMAKLN